MKIITAIKSWFCGKKPLAHHGWKFLGEISSVGCTEAEKPTARAGLIGPLLGCSWCRAPAGGQDLGHAPPSDPRPPARLSPHPSGSWRGPPRCSPRRSPPRAVPGSCARAARSPAPPAHGGRCRRERQRAAARGGTTTVCRGAPPPQPRSAPALRQGKEPSPPRVRRALPCWLRGRGCIYSFAQWLSFKGGLHVKQLPMPRCSGPPPVFWWVVLDLRHERLRLAGLGTLRWDPQLCRRLLLHKAWGWALTFSCGGVRAFTLFFSPPCPLEGCPYSGLTAANAWWFLAGGGAWPGMALQEAGLALTGTLVHQLWRRQGLLTLPMQSQGKNVAVDSRGCMYPKAHGEVRRGGVLSLPGTDNLRALPMAKYLALSLQGWVSPVICSLLFLGQQWKWGSPSG